MEERRDLETIWVGIAAGEIDSSDEEAIEYIREVYNKTVPSDLTDEELINWFYEEY